MSANEEVTIGQLVAAFNRLKTMLLLALDNKLNSDGIALSADRLSSPFDVEVSGYLTGTGSTDGSNALELVLSKADTGVLAGTYGTEDSIPVLTVNAKGDIIEAGVVTVRRTLQTFASEAALPVLGNEQVLYLVDMGGSVKHFFIWNGTDYVDITIYLTEAQRSLVADKLTQARSISLVGDVNGTELFDGSGDVSITMNLSETGISAGTYSVLTIDSKGRATGGRGLQVNDVPTLNQDTTGNAATATALATSRNISISGAATGNGDFNGTNNLAIAITLADSGVTAGDYTAVTVNAKGLVTAARALLATDIPVLSADKLTSGTLPIARGGTGGTTAAAARTSLGIGTIATRSLTVSTAAPSGGVDGDVWFQY